MGHQIIKENAEPYGFTLFSSYTDTFVMRHVTEEAIVEYFLAEETERTRERIDRITSQLLAGEKPYYQFTLTLEEAIKEHVEHDGDPALVTIAERESIRVTP